MSQAITAADFGRYADEVQEHCGECTLPVGDGYEVHPGAKGGFTVVSMRSGEPLCNYARVEDAVADARSR